MKLLITRTSIIALCALSLAGCSAPVKEAPQVETKTDVNAVARTESTADMVISSVPAAIKAGEPVTLAVHLLEKTTGKPFPMLETSEKPLDLYVISQDLSWFNHLQVTPDKKGDFTIKTQLPKSGQYFVYAEFMPDGKTPEIAQTVLSTKDATPSSPDLVVSPVDRMWAKTLVSAHPQGQPDAVGGKKYQVRLMPMPHPFVVGENAILHFQVRDHEEVPIKNLQPYKGGQGQSIIVSANGQAFFRAEPGAGDVDDVVANHLKGDSKGIGPDVAFHTTFSSPGLYKVWGQFKHEGKIITAPFVVEVVMPESN